MGLPFIRTGDALSQKLADFSKVDTDVYVKWGRSKRCPDKMKPKFISQAAAKDIGRQAGKNMERLGPLLNMPLISRTLPVMHGLPIKQLI
jgi:hypothetical protein